MDHSEDEVIAIFALVILSYLLHRQRHVARPRQYWVHPMNLSRDQDSVKLRLDRLEQFPDRFNSYFRMKPNTFKTLLESIRGRIQKQDTVMRTAIDPITRLYVTLHYLATGSSYQVIATHYALGRSTVSSIIQDTCQAIVDVLGPVYLKPPSSHQEWRSIADK